MTMIWSFFFSISCPELFNLLIIIFVSSIASAILENRSSVIITLSSCFLAMDILLSIIFTAFWEFVCNSLTILSISLVELIDCSANFLISSATTAKPLPASPARAASMAAFKANKFVWSATAWIIWLAVLIFSALWLVLIIPSCIRSI